jgi:hypothetical protein
MVARKLNLCPTAVAHIDQATEENVATSGYHSSEWDLLIAQVKAGEDIGREQLFKVFSRAVRYYLCCRGAQQELEHKIHDMVLIVVEAIQRGDIRDSELLIPFIRRVAHKHLETYIAQTMQNDGSLTDVGGGTTVAMRKEEPQWDAITLQKAALMKQVLSCLSQRDRDILDRFYLQEQNSEHLCGEMCVTETQFRLLKSRVKVKFEELTRKLSNKAVAEDSTAASHMSPYG